MSLTLPRWLAMESGLIEPPEDQAFEHEEWAGWRPEMADIAAWRDR